MHVFQGSPVAMVGAISPASRSDHGGKDPAVPCPASQQAFPGSPPSSSKPHANLGTNAPPERWPLPPQQGTLSVPSAGALPAPGKPRPPHRPAQGARSSVSPETHRDHAHCVMTSRGGGTPGPRQSPRRTRGQRARRARESHLCLSFLLRNSDLLGLLRSRRDNLAK